MIGAGSNFGASLKNMFFMQILAYKFPKVVLFLPLKQPFVPRDQNPGYGPVCPPKKNI
jgi:hypothetical protein